MVSTSDSTARTGRDWLQLAGWRQAWRSLLRRPTYFAAAVITLGFGTMVAASGLGLAGLLQAEPRLHALLKHAGAAYLAYLAWRIARADGGAGDIGARGRPIGLLEAALFTWTNPKAWMSGLGALAAYSTAVGYADVLSIDEVVQDLDATLVDHMSAERHLREIAGTLTAPLESGRPPAR